MSADLLWIDTMTKASTIYALSSGQPPAGVAVIRVSGPHVANAILALTGKESLSPRVATLATIHDEDGQTIDKALLIHFPAPNSFTGEDVLEIQAHGSRAVVAALLRRLGSLDGFEPAEPGAFTLRAFLNGRMDLTAAEALSDLIVAETEAQRKLAMENTSGAQRRLYEDWRNQLIGIWALAEADLDFSDQEDVPEEFGNAYREPVAALIDVISSHLKGYEAAEIVNEGFHIVVAGPPNAGKSSLINYLSRRDVAIVTDIAGTTRDLIDVRMEIGGHLVKITDTAGLRESSDAVETIGIERARHAMKAADLVLYLDDGSQKISDDEIGDALRVYTKCDWVDHVGEPRISTVTGEGIDALLEHLTRLIDNRISLFDTVPSRVRHVNELTTCVDCLKRALKHSQTEFVAYELRGAADALGRITGAIDVEELLGSIFSRFCIGK
jgi:tRNA modification GTPase